MRNFLVVVGSFFAIAITMIGGSYLLGSLKQVIFGAGKTMGGATKSPIEEGMAIVAFLSVIGIIAFFILA